MIPRFAEQELRELLQCSNVDWTSIEGENRSWYDFEIRKEGGPRIAVLVTATLNFPWVSRYHMGAVAARRAGCEEFWIVLHGQPRKNLAPTLGDVHLQIPHRLLSLEDFASAIRHPGKQLPTPSPNPLRPLGDEARPTTEIELRPGVRGLPDAESPRSQRRTKLDSHVLEKRRRNSSQLRPGLARHNLLRDLAIRVPPRDLDFIRTQLPSWYELGSMSRSNAVERLSIGKQQDRVIVVMSDIKDFSSIVDKVEGDLVNEMLFRYYQCARAKVRFHGGTFDKFIGDAVLAVFNYPVGAKSPFRSAVEFSADLIRDCGAVLHSFLGQGFLQLETGTRVAIATGGLRPIDVGSEHLQLSFIGNPVNRVARLQAKAPLDGIVMCQRTYSLLSEEDPAFAGSLDVVPKTRRKGSLKGVDRSAHTQVVSADTISKLAH